MGANIDRRTAVIGGISFGLSLIACNRSFAQLLPRLHLLLVRREGLSPTNQCLAPCIRGSLYDITGQSNSATALLPGLIGDKPICDIIERPWRNNAPNVSAIPSGEYESKIRDDATKSWMTDINRRWRIELLGVEHRSNIQFHYGQDEKWSEGCFIVGEHIQAAEAGGITSEYCKVTNSEQSVAKLRVLFEADGHSGKPPKITIINSQDIFPGTSPSC